MLKQTTSKAGFKKDTKRTSAPVAKPSRSLEHIDGGGMQHSEHPKKDQPKTMRFLRR